MSQKANSQKKRVKRQQQGGKMVHSLKALPELFDSDKEPTTAELEAIAVENLEILAAGEVNGDCDFERTCCPNPICCVGDGKCVTCGAECKGCRNQSKAEVVTTIIFDPQKLINDILKKQGK